VVLEINDFQASKWMAFRTGPAARKFSLTHQPATDNALRENDGDEPWKEYPSHRPKVVCIHDPSEQQKIKRIA